MKKIISVMLCVVIAFCTFPGATVFAADENIPYHICEYEPYVEKSTYSSSEGYSPDGEKGFKCKVCGDKKDVEVIPGVRYVNFSPSYEERGGNSVYTGKVIKPTVYVWQNAQNRLTEGVDYEVEYIGTCKEIGRHKVVVKFKGDYAGRTARTFDIQPPSVKVKSVKSTKNGFKVNWKKLDKKYDIDGYTVTVLGGNYNDEVMGTHCEKEVKIKDRNKTSVTIKGLKRNTKYYICVLAYKKKEFDYKPYGSAKITSKVPDDGASWQKIRYKTK